MIHLEEEQIYLEYMTHLEESYLGDMIHLAEEQIYLGYMTRLEESSTTSDVRHTLRRSNPLRTSDTPRSELIYLVHGALKTRSLPRRNAFDVEVVEEDLNLFPVTSVEPVVAERIAGIEAREVGRRECSINSIATLKRKATFCPTTI